MGGHPGLEAGDFTIHGAAFLLFNGDKIEELRPYSDAWLQMIARSQLVKS
jgi:hypothetical protein